MLGFRHLLLAGSCWVLAALGASANERQTILYEGKTTEAREAKVAGKDLWVSPAELTRATRLELKPEGVCTARACFPIPPTRKQEFLGEDSGKVWFNLSGFARLLKQPVAHDDKHAVWFIGPRPEVQNGYLTTLLAPDFTLPDLNGKDHSLRDFRGKKVLLLTWGSW